MASSTLESSLRLDPPGYSIPGGKSCERLQENHKDHRKCPLSGDARQRQVTPSTLVGLFTAEHQPEAQARDRQRHTLATLPSLALRASVAHTLPEYPRRE